MTRLRRVLISTSLAAFAAGVGVGLAVPVVADVWGGLPAAPNSVLVRDYLERFESDFSPSDAQLDDVRTIMLFWLERIDAIRNAGYDQDVEEDLLVEANGRMNRRIELLLDPHQKKRYRDVYMGVGDPPRDRPRQK